MHDSRTTSNDAYITFFEIDLDTLSDNIQPPMRYQILLESPLMPPGTAVMPSETISIQENFVADVAEQADAITLLIAGLRFCTI